MHNLNVNLTHATSTPGQTHLEYGPRSVGCESCLVEQRIRRSTDGPQTQVMAVPGKTPARTDTRQSIQRDRQMRSVWVDVELLAERRLHRKTSRNSSMSSHAGRSHSPTARAPNRTDENGIRGSAENREFRSQTRTDVSDSKNWTPSFHQHPVWDGKPTRKRNTRSTATPKTAIHLNSGDAEFGSPATPQWTGRVPGRCNTQKNGSGIHVDDNVETREHDSVSTTNPSKPAPEVVVE